jgi:hypothetical protein
MGPADRRFKDRLGHEGQIADGAQTQGSESGGRRWTDTPKSLDRQRMQEGQLLAGPDHHHPGTADRAVEVGPGLGRLGGQFGKEFDRSHTNRAGEPEFGSHIGSDGTSDPGGTPEQAGRARDVKEGLVERDPFHEGGVALK